MPKISFSGDTSIEALHSAIHLLRAQESKWRKTGSKRTLRRYLNSVFDLHARWKRAGKLLPATTLVSRLFVGKKRSGRHPIRTLIDATSNADRRSKSRWTQALRYACRERAKWPTLAKCLRANGGIAGCASKWADQQSWKRTPPGFVRVGGEGLPKVPLLVSVDLLDEEPWRSFVRGPWFYQHR